MLLVYRQHGEAVAMVTYQWAPLMKNKNMDLNTIHDITERGKKYHEMTLLKIYGFVMVDLF